MGHRVNEWIQWLLIPVLVVTAIALFLLGFGFWKALVILAPILIASMAVMVLVNPGPRAKGFVEGLKTHFR
jgi:uncharacterized membrane protein